MPPCDGINILPAGGMRTMVEIRAIVDFTIPTATTATKRMLMILLLRVCLPRCRWNLWPPWWWGTAQLAGVASPPRMALGKSWSVTAHQHRSTRQTQRPGCGAGRKITGECSRDYDSRRKSYTHCVCSRCRLLHLCFASSG